MLPPLVGPEPGGGVLLDALGEGVHVGFRHGVWRGVIHGIETADDGVVVAALHAMDIEVVIDGTDLLTDGFSTDDDGAVVAHPLHPVADVEFEGRLVGNESHHNLLPLALAAKEVAQGVLHDDIGSATLAAALGHDAVESLILQGMIHLCTDKFGTDIEVDARDPLPVVVVTEIEDAERGIGSCEIAVEFVDAFEGHVAFDVIDTHRHLLDALHDVVAEPMVETAFDAATFGHRLLRKAVGKMLPHEGFAVAQNVVRQRVEHHVGPNVVQPPRQKREEVKERI